MNYIILDLEATCWKNKHGKNEIIEIGAVKFDHQFKKVDEFCQFIKPIINPQLSDFCKELTTITQVEIDGSENYPTVIEKFKKWINTDESYILCSWGFYDKNQFEKDDKLHGLTSDWVQNHISLKHQYAEINQLSRPMGMGGALKNEKLPLDGTHHRGIDDARNIAKIFLAYAEKWKVN